jgi:hypothetical protein
MGGAGHDVRTLRKESAQDRIALHFWKLPGGLLGNRLTAQQRPHLGRRRPSQVTQKLGGLGLVLAAGRDKPRFDRGQRRRHLSRFRDDRQWRHPVRHLGRNLGNEPRTVDRHRRPAFVEELRHQDRRHLLWQVTTPHQLRHKAERTKLLGRIELGHRTARRNDRSPKAVQQRRVLKEVAGLVDQTVAATVGRTARFELLPNAQDLGGGLRRLRHQVLAIEQRQALPR